MRAISIPPTSGIKSGTSCCHTWLPTTPTLSAQLVRLGTTAKDINRIIESLVDGLIERSVKCPTPRRAIIDCDKLVGQHRHLIRELFVTLWRTQGWPQQAMAFGHWDRLAELVLGPHAEGEKQSLPGSINAARTARRSNSNATMIPDFAQRRERSAHRYGAAQASIAPGTPPVNFSSSALWPLMTWASYPPFERK